MCVEHKPLGPRPQSSLNSPRATMTAEPPTSTFEICSGEPSTRAYSLLGRLISAPCEISISSPNAMRLCRADAGLIYVLDDDVYRMAFALGGSKEYRDYVEPIPIVRGHGTIVGRVGLTRSTVHVRDVLADPDYELHQARKLGGFRTMLGVPMVVHGRVVGVTILWREEVEPFDERTIDLVTTFAAQGAIAIQNVQLFQELQRRERELGQKVDELHTLGETSQAVSSTLDLETVLETIVSRAVELSGVPPLAVRSDDEALTEGVLAACVEGQAGAGAFGSCRNCVQNAWASAVRVTWRCQPR